MRYYAQGAGYGFFFTPYALRIDGSYPIGPGLYAFRRGYGFTSSRFL